MLAARRPGLHGALLAAKAAGHSHVILDGTLISADRVSAPGPTAGVDLWWSGTHKHHGGNIQVVSAPDGWPLWTCDGNLALAGLGYQGEADTLMITRKSCPSMTSSPSRLCPTWCAATS